MERVGVWIIGACGSVSSLTIGGALALKRGLATPIGLVTELPELRDRGLGRLDEMVFGGHEIRGQSLPDAAAEVFARTPGITPGIFEAIRDELGLVNGDIRGGTASTPAARIQAIADRQDIKSGPPKEVVALIQDDLRDFRQKHGLDHVVVVNLSSTEPLFAGESELRTAEDVESAIADNAPLPPSVIYAAAAFRAGCSYVNFTPSSGAAAPGLGQLAEERGCLFGGSDGKTGETLVKSILAPMFVIRNLEVMSWVGHNILGNRDGEVLQRPENRESKVKTKDKLTSDLLGYSPQTLISIEYIKSLGEGKTAWDHIHFRGFLGVPMAIQFIWQGVDSALAAPLILDMVRLTHHYRCKGQVGLMRSLAVFFKNPMGVTEHNLQKQFDLLVSSI